jgi:hypothetical protein
MPQRFSTSQLDRRCSSLLHVHHRRVNEKVVTTIFENFQIITVSPGGEFFFCFKVCFLVVTVIVYPMKMLEKGSAESKFYKTKITPWVQRRARALSQKIFFEMAPLR